MEDVTPIYTTCPFCNGTGKDPVCVAMNKLAAVMPERCPDCNGTGKLPTNERQTNA